MALKMQILVLCKFTPMEFETDVSEEGKEKLVGV